MIPWHFPRDNLKSSSCLQIPRSFASWFGGCDPQSCNYTIPAFICNNDPSCDIHLLARVTPPSLLEYALGFFDECFVVLQMVPGARLIMA